LPVIFSLSLESEKITGKIDFTAFSNVFHALSEECIYHQFKELLFVVSLRQLPHLGVEVDESFEPRFLLKSHGSVNAQLFHMAAKVQFQIPIMRLIFDLGQQTTNELFRERAFEVE
jgi:hypothetical protein